MKGKPKPYHAIRCPNHGWGVCKSTATNGRRCFKVIGAWGLTEQGAFIMAAKMNESATHNPEHIRD